MGKIKSLLLLFVLATVLSIPLQAQTNAFTSWNDQNIFNNKGEVTGKKITATFTMDSLGVVLLSQPIGIDEFIGVDFATHPVKFRFKTVSTYDSSSTRIRLLGCFQSVTDTIALDTLRHWGATGVTANQIETDSLGTLGFEGGAGVGTNTVRIAIECLRADVNSGTLDLLFVKPD